MRNCYFKRYLFATAVAACSFAGTAYAAPVSAEEFVQTAVAADTVKGIVFDEFARQVAGVKISVAGNPGVSTTSAADGTFKIIAVQGDQLLLSHKDYNAQKQKVKGNDLKIRLIKTYLTKPDTISVLYDRVQADNYLGSVSTIYNNQVITTPATIFPYALTGRLPGLQTLQLRGYRTVGRDAALTLNTFVGNLPAAFGNAEPNDNTELQLRLRGMNPVTIIDGVQREFSSLDFENIESISVLKDALSTIMLGQRSSNGIILVTTKKPVAGPPRISFTAQTAMQESLGLPKPLPAYQYAYLFNEASLNSGRTPAYTSDDFEAYRNGSDPFGHPDVNWFSTLLRKRSPMRKYNLGIDGGSSKARYIVSLGYLNQQGMFKDYKIEPYNTNTEFTRYTINTNVDVNLTDKFNVSLQLFGRLQNGNQPGATTENLLTGLYNTPNNAYPIKNPNGSFAGSNDFKTNLYSMLTQSGYIIDNSRDVMVNLDLTYKFDDFVKGLWVKAKGNLTTSENTIVDRSKASAVYQRVLTTAGDTVYNQYGSPADQINNFSLISSSQFWYAQVSTGLDRSFGLNNFSALLMADQRLATINFDLPYVNTNFAGKLSYNYNNKYFSELALNYSGHDRFEPGKRFGLFYAGGLGWKISEESFIKDNVSWINSLKLRATFGLTGNYNIGYFTYRTAFNSDKEYFFGSQNPGPTSGRRELPTLVTSGATWEKAHKLNIGVDLSILNNTLQVTAEYYNNKYFDLMQQRGKASNIIGADYPTENIGINRYTGGELTVTYQNRINDFNYFVTANGSIEQTKVLFMDEVTRRYAYQQRTGLPVGTGWGYRAEGIIQTEEQAATHPAFENYTLRPGDLALVDVNGDGIISDFDQVPLGTQKPRIYYGATLGFSYKGFDMSVLLQGVHNRVISRYYGINTNTQAWMPLLNRWTPANAANATSPRLSLGGDQNNTPLSGYGLGNSFFELSGNFLRIKNVDIGYNLPHSIVSRLGVKGLRVFVNGLNLMTFSENEGIDPEVNGNVYPIQRVFNTGFNIKL